MHKELRPPGERPDPSLAITRRIFLHKSLLAGAAAGTATYGWFPLINTLDVAFGAEAFKFAWLSDNHLYPKNVNTRFVEKATRAVKEIQAMSPPADFLIHGGDLAQLGDPVELSLGNDILKEVKIRKVFIPGEHDWYLDMGAKWQQLFGPPNWTFDHKGVRFVGLDTVSRGPDYWTAKTMTPKERMGHMATLASSWTWPYAPEGVPTLTRCLVRVDPGDHFDGVGWSRLTMTAAEKIENQYVMWRKDKDIFAEAPSDSGCADNVNQTLQPRIADREWPYYGAYK